MGRHTLVVTSKGYREAQRVFTLPSEPGLIVNLEATMGTLSLEIIEQGIEHLAPGGRLLLYTGAAIIECEDVFHAVLRERLSKQSVRWTYDEIDPDVFGEELEHPPYDRVDRIAVVAVTIELA